MISRKEQQFIKSLHQKKNRVSQRCFLMEGAKNVIELLNSSYSIRLIICTDFFVERFKPNFKKVPYKIVSSTLIENLGTFNTNSFALGVVEIPPQKGVDIDNQHIFALDSIRDPGNLGTIIRSLDWFGYTQVLCSEDCADAYQPKVVNSSMGSILRMNLHYTSLERTIQKLDLPVYGASTEGSEMYDTEFASPSIIVIGNESKGISKDLQKLILNKNFCIPQYGKAESLNAAVSTGIIASYLRRRLKN